MRTILLTGASGNLGQAVTNDLLSKGYTIEAAAGRNPNELPVHQNLNATPVDLMDAGAAGSFVQAAISRNQRLNAGILLVGGFAVGDLTTTGLTDIDKMITLNFKTAWNVAQPLFEHFAQNGGGQIIFVGTRSAIEPASGQHFVAYSLAKSLVFRLAEMINEAGKTKNITATVLVPSVIDTPQNRAAMPDGNPSNWVSPEAIANTIAFTLTDSGMQLREAVLKLYNRS